VPVKTADADFPVMRIRCQLTDRVSSRAMCANHPQVARRLLRRYAARNDNGLRTNQKSFCGLFAGLGGWYRHSNGFELVKCAHDQSVTNRLFRKWHGAVE